MRKSTIRKERSSVQTNAIRIVETLPATTKTNVGTAVNIASTNRDLRLSMLVLLNRARELKREAAIFMETYPKLEGF